MCQFCLQADITASGLNLMTVFQRKYFHPARIQERLELFLGLSINGARIKLTGPKIKLTGPRIKLTGPKIKLTGPKIKLTTGPRIKLRGGGGGVLRQSPLSLPHITS